MSERASAVFAHKSGRGSVVARRSGRRSHCWQHWIRGVWQQQVRGEDQELGGDRGELQTRDRAQDRGGEELRGGQRQAQERDSRPERGWRQGKGAKNFDPQIWRTLEVSR